VDHARLTEGKLHSRPEGEASNASGVNPALAGSKASAATQQPATLPILVESATRVAGAFDDAGSSSKPLVQLSAPAEAPGTVAITQTESAGALAKAAAPGDSLEQLQLLERPTLQTAGQSVVKGVRYLATNGGETLTIRLVPESLGVMHIVVKSGDNAIEVTLVSANQSVRESLEQHLPALREMFGRDGIDVSKVSIVAQSATADTIPSGGPLDRQSAEHGPTRDGTHRGADEDRDNAESETHHYRRPKTEHAGSLDVLV
jgi:flagellar hook-length control protein FliK